MSLGFLHSPSELAGRVSCWQACSASAALAESGTLLHFKQSPWANRQWQEFAGRDWRVVPGKLLKYITLIRRRNTQMLGAELATSSCIDVALIFEKLKSCEPAGFWCKLIEHCGNFFTNINLVSLSLDFYLHVAFKTWLQPDACQH